MIEVRFHGRGGQGAVTSAELMALAAIASGKFAQAFPSFGPERRGAPLQAFLRISEHPIRRRDKIYEPNIVVVLDPSLLISIDVTVGLKHDGILVINSTDTIKEMRMKYTSKHIAIVDAAKIAETIMGVPITNTPMLGALLKATKLLSLDSLTDPINERFGRLADKNLAAMKQAYNETIIME